MTAKVIVVTGGIGSGKSTVVDILATVTPTINADDIVNQIYQDLDHPTTRTVIDLFGSDIVEDGRVNKSILRTKLHTTNDWGRLGELFSDPVRKALRDFAETADSELVTWEVPLATESGWRGDYHIMVYCPEQVRISRVMKRSNLTRDEVLKRISLQATVEQQLANADYVVLNNKAFQECTWRTLDVYHDISNCLRMQK